MAWHNNKHGTIKKKKGYFKIIQNEIKLESKNVKMTNNSAAMQFRKNSKRKHVKRGKGTCYLIAGSSLDY